MPTKRVDEVLADLVKPLGLWQVATILSICLSLPNAAIIAVFVNSFPNYRCKAEPVLEEYFTQNNLTFLEAANVIGPVDNTTSFISACQMYNIQKPENFSLANLLYLYSESRSETTTCKNGYIHEYADYQYKGGVVPEWSLYCDRAWQVPFNESAYVFGMLIGYICGGWFTDRMGRRRVMLIVAALEVLTHIATVLSPNHVVYIICRILAACFSAARFSACNVLITEISTPKYRATLSAIQTICQLSAQRALLSSMSLVLPYWRQLYGVILGCSCLSFFGFFIIPESPKWLLARGDIQGAGKVLYRGYRINTWFSNLFKNKTPPMSEEEFMECIGFKETAGGTSPDGAPPKKPKISMLHLFNHEMAKTTLLSIVIFTCQTTCVLGMSFYASSIRAPIALVIILNSIVIIPGAFLAALLFRVCRYRKKPLFSVVSCIVACLWFVGLFTVLLQPESDLLLTIMANVIMLGQQATQKMIFVYIPELYSPLYRTQAMGLAAGLSRLGGSTYPLINRLDSTFRHGFPLIIFATITTVQMVVILFLKDTNGEVMLSKKLPENEKDLEISESGEGENANK